ncbi:MAG: hypothetical protein ACI8ZM_005029 [Crocinitomix sp.]|jgi:hypothetical protein
MGFFQKMKSKLGIGGVKIEIKVPGQISKEGAKVVGSFQLSTKSDQEITVMSVKLVERYTTGRGDDEKTKDFTLGSQDYKDLFTIKTGETPTFEFDFPFEILNSNSDDLKEKGGLMGKLGSAAKFANKEVSEYFVEVDVDVKAAALDPTEEVEVKLV